ncbi:MAG: hypothetical protein AAGD01_13560 [Acidobacteriota bacterium]
MRGTEGTGEESSTIMKPTPLRPVTLPRWGSPLFALALALALVLSLASDAAAQRPPCNPCAGLLVEEPGAWLESLAAAPQVTEDQRLYLAWTATVTDAAEAASGTAAVQQAGATPWLRVIFTTPSPVIQHATELDAELQAAAAAARSAADLKHYQVLWQPASGEATLEDYAFLFKRASVTLAGANPEARILTAPLGPSFLGAGEEQLARFYGEDVAAYLDGIALAPGLPDLAATVTQIQQIDPGRPVVLDASDLPSDPWLALADAAAAAEAGVAVTLFAAPSSAAAAPTVAPFKLLAREFAGDLSLDPYSRPEGAQQAWSFVRGEDLQLRVIARTPEDLVVDTGSEEGAEESDSFETTSELALAFPDPRLKRPTRIERETLEARDLFGLSRSDEALTIPLNNPGSVEVLRLERMSAEELASLAGTALAERLEIESERQMPVEEILRRLQAFEDSQRRRLPRYTATNITHLRFQFGTGVQGLEVSFEGPFFYEEGEGFDWVWETYYFNGVRWTGDDLPQIPLIQPEKAATQPVDITFTKEYSYRLRGTDEVDGRSCWVVDFEPTGEVGPGRTLYQGTVWVDREHFGRVRTRALQLGLEGDVLSNEETVYYRPVDAGGQPVEAWSPEAYWLPLRTVGQQLLSVLNATTVVDSERLLSGLRLDPQDFETQRQAALDSDATMVRDTQQGLRYLVKDEETGERVVQEGNAVRGKFLIGGAFYDESQDFPLPLAGINYFDLDFRGTGNQLNVFFAGVLAIANYAEPQLFGSQWDAGASLFALAVSGEDIVFRDDEEIEAETVESRPARFSLFLGRPLGEFGKLDFTYSLGYQDFGDADDADPNFIVPEDHFVQSFAVEARYNRSGYRLLAEWERSKRGDWARWGLPGTPDFDNFDPDTEEFTTWGASIGKTWWLNNFRKVGIQLEYLDGENLDRFSKYEFGYFSDSRVRGYQSDKIRAESAYAAHLTYGFEVGELLRLEAVGDAAWATDEATGLEDEFLAGVGVVGNFVGPWDTLVNLDVGVAVAGPDDGVSVFVAFLKLFD